MDHRIDLYGLGALWYALFVGEPPMFMMGAEMLIRMALGEALQAHKDVPAEIGQVITRLLADSPDRRYAGANEVIALVSEITGVSYPLETEETVSSYALRTRFVNREVEIKTLQSAWEGTKAGEGKMVFISGESGMGKTRLVEELEIQAEMDGARVVWGQCVESGGSAYRPWREVLRVLMRYITNGSDAGVEMSRVGPVLAALLPELWERSDMAGLSPPAELDPQAARQRLDMAILQAMQAAAKLRPTMVMIENAHWADESSLEFLKLLARMPGAPGLMICVTYRSDQVSAQHSLVTLAGEQVLRIAVERLTPEITTDLAGSMLGLRELPPLLAEQLQRMTAGNALFVQELIRSLAVEGKVLRRTMDGWQVDQQALAEAQLPESIRQVVERRLDQLSADARQVLGWAAVMGIVFWEGAIAEMGHVARAQVRMALREVVELKFVAPRDESSFIGESEYLFFNPTVREVGYNSIVPQERQECHQRAAAWLMLQSDDQVGEHLGLIAEHLERAGQTEDAADYLRRAGDQAVDRFANTEAAEYFSRALDLTPESERAKRYDLLLAREKVYDLQGRREAQYQDLESLQTLADALDDARKAQVALRLSQYCVIIGDYSEASAVAWSAINLGQETGDVAVEAAGFLQSGIVLWRQGSYQPAQAQFEQALVLAQGASLRSIEADCLLNMGNLFEVLGDLAESKTYCGQALPIYREVGNRQGESWVFNMLGLISLYSGEYIGARNYYEQSLRIGQEIGDRRRESVALGNFGGIDRALGQYERAREYYTQSMQIAREIGNREQECDRLFNLGLLLHQMGNDKDALSYAEQGLRIAQEIGARRPQGYALTILGHVLTGLDRLTKAAQIYRQALDTRRELDEHKLAMEPLAGLARIVLAQGGLAEAQAHVDAILAYLETNDLEGTHEPLRVYLTCYRVLHANQDPRARSILDTAYHLLQDQADKITDVEMYRSFRENVNVHSEIVKLGKFCVHLLRK
ncbi:MAG: tetratricopeptide repeat protein [Chloroflexi bacterium]|nr:tetratricopeptide repeat protein [Chloroflexota bacterium]